MIPQNQMKKTHDLDDKNDATKLDENNIKQSVAEKPKLIIVWKNVIIHTLVHIAGAYGFYLFLFKALWSTDLYACVLIYVSEVGVFAGTHRLWSHKAYKARLPLKILLLFMTTLAYQDPVLVWVRDHRMHHKYVDTDADPYNSRRGFFFSHIGWVLVKKHPDIKTKAHTIDLSDVVNDALLKFQSRHYLTVGPLVAFVIPAYMATLWGESLWNAFFVSAIFRYIYSLNMTFFINSAAHMWGYKPYDKNICPTENKFVSLVTFGEGFHNYHHTFPWDYKAAELGSITMNSTRIFIELMAAIGWAYDLRVVSDDVIKQRVQRTGDGSYGIQ